MFFSFSLSLVQKLVKENTIDVVRANNFKHKTGPYSDEDHFFFIIDHEAYLNFVTARNYIKFVKIMND